MFPNYERTKEREISYQASVGFVGREGFGQFRFEITFWNGKFLRFRLRENLTFGCWQTKMQILGYDSFLEESYMSIPVLAQVFFLPKMRDREREREGDNQMFRFGRGKLRMENY